MIPNRNKALLLAGVMVAGLAPTVAPTVAGAASLVEIQESGQFSPEMMEQMQQMRQQYMR